MQPTTHQVVTGAQPAATPGNGARAAFTIDVEDWYQSSVDFDAAISERVIHNVERVRAVLAAARVKASFFVQGRVAETFPQLLQELVADGHEIQSHGYSHRPLSGMNRPQLRDELRRARGTVEDACGVRVTAFRAPDFSIGRRNLWALEELVATGFEMDSSIFPKQMARYGIDGWATAPQRISLANGASIWEAPVAVWEIAGCRVPVAGGGYFRLLPGALLERAFRAMIANGQPVIVYCHPYEFNGAELAEYRGRVSGRFLLAQQLGRRSFVRRVQRLLAALPFGRFDEVMAAWRKL